MRTLLKTPAGKRFATAAFLLAAFVYFVFAAREFLAAKFAAKDSLRGVEYSDSFGTWRCRLPLPVGPRVLVRAAVCRERHRAISGGDSVKSIRSTVMV